VLQHWLTIAREVTWQSAWDWFSGVPLRILGTIVTALVLRWLLHRFINRVVATTTSKSAARLVGHGRAGRVLAGATGLAHERHVQRTRTTGALLRSSVTVVIALVTTLTVMAMLEIPLGPLLASAGVGGVALGFGAQSLVKDFLSGIFMIVEDQYGVGDVIDTGEVIGTVEDVTLRVTKLRDGNGVAWYVRNGEIIRIGNKSQGWSTAIVDVPVSYAESLERVLPIIREVVHAMDADPDWQDRLLEEPVVVGVESIQGNVVTVRVTARCAPNENLTVQRELRQRVKDAFDSAGVKAPAFAPFGLGPR
jgi:small-conductance mechanosensitive channel